MNTVLRRAVRAPARVVQRRAMSGGHGPKPVYEGLEAKIRVYLPENHHMAMGYLGFYFGLYAFVKMLPGGSAKPAPVAAAVATGGDMPSADSAEFGEWVGQEGNLEKLINSA